MRVVRYLFRASDQDPWISAAVASREKDPGSEIVDVIPVDASGRAAVAVTAGQGIYRTTDGGQTWSDFSFADPRLSGAAKVRLVSVGSEHGLYALIDNSSEGAVAGQSYPLRYERLENLDRLRIGLARLIGGEVSP